jgi:hypothetical protein
LRDRVALQFSAALKEAFDQIVYPSINTALRATGINLAFAGNQNGEETIRKTLADAQKFTTSISDDSFQSRAEGRLFGPADAKTVLWSDFKRNAAVNTNWPLHKPSALEDLKADCIRRGLWREEGTYIRRGPFPPPAPSVEIRELSREEDGDGHTYLKIEPLHATSVVFETGDSVPTVSSSPVPTPAKFEAKGLRYRFMAFDPASPERSSPVRDWTATLRVKCQLHNRGDHYEVEMLALPKANGVVIRYTTDGSAPTGAAAATYGGMFRVPVGCRVVCAVAVASAHNLVSEAVKITIPQPGKAAPTLDPLAPARWRQLEKRDDAEAVWNFIKGLEKAPDVRVYDMSITAESTDGHQILEYTGALDDGYDAAALRALADKMQDLVGGGSLRLTVGSFSFPTGQGLLDWLKASNKSFDITKVA